MMKKIISLTGIILASFLTVISAQVGIDKTSGFGSSAILEFGTEARGIRLMPVTDATALTATEGTVVFDGATGSFRYYNGTAWSVAASGGCNTCGAPTAIDITTKGALIGTDSSTAEGVLILGTDTGETKGLVLPNVDLVEAKIPNPPSGLMVYDTSNNTIKVYNGNAWTSF